MNDNSEILIVEDSLLQAEMLRRLLEEHGYLVALAANGKEALSKLRSSAPRLIISDILMPEMDGYELCAEIKRNTALRRIPILLLTTLSDPEDVIRGLEARADGYLTKPYDPEYLVSKVRSVLAVPADGTGKEVPLEFKTIIGGKSRTVTADPRSFFDLLLSTYENTVHTNQSLLKVRAELEDLNRQLDDKVKERTDHLVKEVAEHNRAEEALLESHERFRSVVEAANDPIIGIDTFGKIVMWNSAATRTFGYSIDEVMGEPVALIMPERFRHLHEIAVDRARESGRLYYAKHVREVAGLRKDGTEFPIETSLSAWKTREGIFFTAVVRDITERKQAEESLKSLSEDLMARNEQLTTIAKELKKQNEEVQLKTQQLWQAAKLATIGELAASIAHELNNPLATVSLRTEGMLMRTPPDHPSRRSLEIIEQEVERMANLVANLLQFSRRYRPQISTIDVREEMDRTLELIRGHLRNHHINIERQCSPNLKILADRQQLVQVFLNLFTNASDGMPDGGTLTIRTGIVEEKPGNIFIEIGDSGKGIAPENLEKIMEPFFTTKPEGKGTGLGLPICKRIINDHGGTLELTSEYGKGTKISIVLPMAGTLHKNVVVDTGVDGK